MKDFVVMAGNLGGGKTLTLTDVSLQEAEKTANKVADRQRRIDEKEITIEQAKEEAKHDRQVFINYPLKIAVLKADLEKAAQEEEKIGNKYKAMALRDIPNHLFFLGSLDMVPKTPQYVGVQSAAKNVYNFIADRRAAMESDPLPDEDEGRDFLGLDEAQDLLRSRRSGDKYVKVVAENADFFRKMGLETWYQGPNQPQMDKNFRGKNTKKCLAEKFEYADPVTGESEDPETHINYYFIKITIFDVSNLEKHPPPSVTRYIDYPTAKKVHKYYGSNVFQSQSMTTKNTLSEFLSIPLKGAQAGLTTDEQKDDEPEIASPKELLDILKVLAEQQKTLMDQQVEMAEELEKNFFANMDPKDAKIAGKWLLRQALASKNG